MPIEVWRSRHGDPNAAPFVNDRAFPTAIIVIASNNRWKSKGYLVVLFLYPFFPFILDNQAWNKAPDVLRFFFKVQNKSCSLCCVLCIKEKRKGEIRNISNCAVYEGFDLPLTLPSMVTSGEYLELETAMTCGLCFCGGVW
jgi:hypothetical protein